jgi:hypothetical protein
MAEAADAAWKRATKAYPPTYPLLSRLPEAQLKKLFGHALRGPWPLSYSVLAQVDQASDRVADGPRFAPALAELSEPERDSFRAFRGALHQWAQRYGLASGWLYDLAVQNLCRTWERPQDVLRIVVSQVGALNPTRDFAFRTRGYTGSETPSEYARDVRALLDQAMERHLDSTIRRFRHRHGGERIGFIDSRTRENVRLAAMWQVSDCSWSDFLERSGLVATRRKHEQTAEALRKLLREIGLEPRAGIGAHH